MSYNRREILASLKCMRCGSRNGVREYDFHEVVDSKKLSKTTTQYTHAHTYIPICNKCHHDFDVYKKFSEKNFWSWCGGSISSCILFILIMNFVVAYNAKQPIDAPWQIFSIVLAILDIVFISHITLIGLKARAMVENPKKYMKNIEKQPFVRPMGAPKWISYSEWLKSAAQENFAYQHQNQNEANEIMYSTPKPEIITRDKHCGNCGKLISPNQKFCVNCGSMTNT